MSTSILTTAAEVSTFSSFATSHAYSACLLPMTTLTSSALRACVANLLIDGGDSFTVFYSSLLSGYAMHTSLPYSGTSLCLAEVSCVYFTYLSPPIYTYFYAF